MGMGNKGTFWGLSFVLLGILLLTGKWGLLGDFGFIDAGTVFGIFWPTLFVIPLGVGFHLFYFFNGRKWTGLLIPGGILLGAGLVCQISMLFDIWGSMWPGFPLAVAFGLFEFYLFGGRNKWLLIPIYILGTVSVLFFSIFSLGTLFSMAFSSVNIALLFIFIGVLMMFDRKRSRRAQ
jgi:hypothetical protein